MKSITTFLSFIILIGIAATSTAQNQVFSLVSKVDKSQAVSVSNGALTVLSIDESSSNKAQKFILKRLINGNIMIASAAHPDMCFKHTGTGVELAKLEDNTSDFEWRIEFMADDEYLFKHAELTDQCLTINEENNLTVSPISIIRRKTHKGCCSFVLIPEDNPF